MAFPSRDNENDLFADLTLLIEGFKLAFKSSGYLWCIPDFTDGVFLDPVSAQAVGNCHTSLSAEKNPAVKRALT